MTEIRASAEFSACGLRRLRLDRWWRNGPRALVCMCNPSRADGDVNDPTVLRLIALLSGRSGIAGFTVVNWHDFIATDPAELHKMRHGMMHENEPAFLEVCAANLLRIRALSEAAPTRIVAWGDLVPMERHTTLVMRAMSWDGAFPLYAFGLTAGGAPKHPMARGKSRIPDDAPLIVWRDAVRSL